MFEHVFLWVVGILIFSVITMFFHLFPRAVGGGAILALFLGKADLGSQLGIFSVVTGQGNMDGFQSVLAGILFLWIVGGLVIDLTELKARCGRLLTLLSMLH